MPAKINIPDAAIHEFSQRWNITELALFGSVLRDDFGPDSDIDMLVTLPPDAGIGLFEFARMERELSELLGRKVDLVSKRGVEQSRNYIMRKSILSNVEVVYAANTA